MTKESRAMCNTKNFKIRFLGTGAADWTLADKIKTPYFRRNSSIIINGHILVDCGPDIAESIHTFNIGSDSITDILLTHSHKDHISPETLTQIADSKKSGSPINLWAHIDTVQVIPQLPNIKLCPLNTGQSFKIANININALPANHHVESTGETCLHYLFDNSDIKWLYAVDGAWLTAEEWHILNGRNLDAVIIDATIGEDATDYRIFEHNNLPMVRQIRNTMLKNSAIKPGGKFYLTHLAYTLHPSHEILSSNLNKEEFIVAYDGMEIEI